MRLRDDLVRSCTASYARFMGRLTREEEELYLMQRPSGPRGVTLEGYNMAVLGQLAARDTSDLLAAPGQVERFDLDSLGSVAFYTIRASTLGGLALPGQTVLVSTEREPKDGEPVIALLDDKVYARHLGLSLRDPSRVMLWSDRSYADNVPPILQAARLKARLMPSIAVLFDNRSASWRDEAMEVDGSPLLTDNLHAARVVDHSAHPIIRHGDMVLLEWPRILDPSTLGSLEGAIVAVVATRDGQAFGLLKRVGQRIDTRTRLFEKIGLHGDSIPIVIGADENADAFVLQHLWVVNGVLRSGH